MRYYSTLGFAAGKCSFKCIPNPLEGSVIHATLEHIGLFSMQVLIPLSSSVSFFGNCLMRQAVSANISS